MGSGKKPVGPSADQLAAQAEAEKRSKEAEDSANSKLSSAKKAAIGSRTGRRLLIAPGREDDMSKLGSSSQSGF